VNNLGQKSEVNIGGQITKLQDKNSVVCREIFLDGATAI